MPKSLKNSPEIIKEKKDYLRERAIGYIALRARSEKEINDYLFKKSKFFPGIITEKEIAEIIVDLKEENFINDLKFITWWVESRNYFRPKSKIILIQELRQKGVGRDIIGDYFENNSQDELVTATTIIGKYIKKYKGLDNKQQFQKVVSHLMRSGFSYQIAKSAFEEFVK
jgi:regulatory protein